MSNPHGNSIHWFRKCLRLHDNPAIVDAAKSGGRFWPIFILDPIIAKNMKVGPNRWRFLVQSLRDLDSSLQKFNSRLFVLRGKPKEVFPDIVKRWQVKCLTFESDTEPYAIERDREIENLMKELGVKVVTHATNLLYNPEQIIEYNGKVPLTYQSFVNTAEKIGLPPQPSSSVEALEKLMSEKKLNTPPIEDTHDVEYGVPTLEELGVNESQLNPCKYPGGETEALKRLQKYLPKEEYICKFAKPDTSPNSIEPSTTVLSPYVKFGCLSARLFYHEIRKVYLKSKKGYTKPPVSLHGQLFWREFYYTAGFATPNFDKMVGNEVCTQIPWIENKEFLEAWTHARTGYPFIDAIMTQLRNEGWIHHLARHAVACFLTRGDLWVSWEHGQKVFEELLLDADWSLNAGNWMWLSASAFFHQYYRVYSPIAFGKKTDKNGDFIRKYVPVLKRFPPEYIYEPWKAPRKLQEQLGCVIGKDYPNRIVDHDKVRVENLRRMDAAYKAKKDAKGTSSSPKTPSPKKSTPKGKRSLETKKDSKITKFLKSK
ncbi:hypothetical protein JTE90_020759 [Oedothorax gibbosus]|uniref:Photolyase/cryptochrome alpha/beta domain-containing protein n=1 Tax=Oedothorax gibbosus TaxID=931172 RepID=A0AAV6TXC7_9ARAC|nr:hypothetical protein JTE90_020759 [Oedothorax gibbosus]